MEMYEQGKRLEVMKERCKMSSRVVSIIQIFTIVGVVLSFVGAVICFTQRNMINEQLAEAVRSGRVTVESIRIGGMLNFMIDYTKAFEAGSFAVPMAVSCITGAVICLIITVVLSMFKNIFNSLVKEDTPFSDYILGRLKVCFIIITIAVLVFVGVGPAVVGALLMWCIYSILEYGKALQTEIDETL